MSTLYRLEIFPEIIRSAEQQDRTFLPFVYFLGYLKKKLMRPLGVDRRIGKRLCYFAVIGLPKSYLTRFKLGVYKSINIY